MFQIGDRVRVKSDLIPGKRYGGIILWKGPMSNSMGNEFIVQDISDDTYLAKYWWHESMLEPVVDTDTEYLEQRLKVGL